MWRSSSRAIKSLTILASIWAVLLTGLALLRETDQLRAVNDHVFAGFSLKCRPFQPDVLLSVFPGRPDRHAARRHG